MKRRQRPRALSGIIGSRVHIASPLRGRKISGLADLPSSLKKLSDEQLGWGRGYTAIRHTTQPLHRELHKSCGRPTSTPDRADTPPIGSSNNLTWADRLPTGSAARHRCDKRSH